MLRFDIVHYIIKIGNIKNLKMNHTNFKYFINTYIGYCFGIIVTLGIIVLFNHAQPALLYLAWSSYYKYWKQYFKWRI